VGVDRTRLDRDTDLAASPLPAGKPELWQSSSVPAVTAVDLFSGAGGASLGLVQAGFDLRLSLDVHPVYAQTHQANLPGEFLAADLRGVDAEKIVRASGVAPGELDLLFAGPPCQGFSMIGSRVVWDERNNLFREVLRLARELRPRAVVIENVPGLLTLADGAYLRAVLAGLDEHGYVAACAELLAAQYGAPQMRWRLIVVGWRPDLGVPPGYGFPAPSLGGGSIGDLVPNQTITTAETAAFVTAREAIGDLPPVAAGEECTTYVGPPLGAYQASMRAGLGSELYNHYAPRLSSANLARLAALDPGQDWRSLPFGMLPPGMQRALRKDHTRRYRRMTWDGVPRAVITRFRDPKSGEYTHPEQDRTITIREPARLQGFPDRFAFHGTRSSQYEQVGNAVPVQLAAAIGNEVGRCLRGNPGPRLTSPFRRRPVRALGAHGQLLDTLWAMTGHEASPDAARTPEDGRSLPVVSPYRQAGRPHVAEWFGHRVYPSVSTSASAVADQSAHRCPFLSDTLDRSTACIKHDNSKGVCSISALSNGVRQDWLVCPYRALDPGLLGRMVRRLYGLATNDPVLVIPAVRTSTDNRRRGLVVGRVDTENDHGDTSFDTVGVAVAAVRRRQQVRSPAKKPSLARVCWMVKMPTPWPPVTPARPPVPAPGTIVQR